MTLDTTVGLDPIDEFIAIAERTAAVPALSEGRFAAASAALCEVAKRLQAANKHMVYWLSRFTSFAIDGDNAAYRLRELRDEFNTVKAGPELHKLKFRCYELGVIFDTKIEPDLDRIFPGDAAAQSEIEQVFVRLRGSDMSMVDFIHNQLVTTIDDYVADVLPQLEAGRQNAAERRRLAFDRDTAKLMVRLVRFSGGLADLILRYADQAGIDVIDEDG